MKSLYLLAFSFFSLSAQAVVAVGPTVELFNPFVGEYIVVKTSTESGDIKFENVKISVNEKIAFLKLHRKDTIDREDVMSFSADNVYCQDEEGAIPLEEAVCNPFSGNETFVKYYKVNYLGRFQWLHFRKEPNGNYVMQISADRLPFIYYGKIDLNLTKL